MVLVAKVITWLCDTSMSNALIFPDLFIRRPIIFHMMFGSKSKEQKRTLYTVLSRFSESSSASCVLADVFHLLPSLHLSHEPRVRGISG